MTPDLLLDKILFPEIEDLLKTWIGGSPHSPKITVLKSILEEMEEGVLIAKEDGAYLFMNKAAQRIFGREDSKSGPMEQWPQSYGLYRMDGSTHVPHDEIPLVRAIRGEITEDVEIFMRNERIPQGLSLLLRGRPLKNEEGEVKGGIVFCRDITGFKQKQVRAQRMADLVAFSPIGVIETTFESQVVSWNSGAEDIYGYRAEEIVGKHYSRLVPLYKLPLMQEQVKKLLAGESVESHETFRVLKDGRTIMTWCSACPLFDSAHSVRGFLLVTRDITERKLPPSEDHARESIVMLSLETSVTGWNPGAEKIYGYTRKEAIGRSLSNLFPEEVQGEIQKLVELAKTGKTFYDFNTLGQRSDGDILDVTFSISPSKNKEGKVVALTVIVRDISELKMAENRISQWKSIVDSSQEGVARDDLDGNILYWNKGCEKIYGYSAEEVIGKPFSMLIPEGMAFEFPKIVECIKAGRSTQYEAVRRRKDGQIIHISVTLSPIRDSAGNVTEASVFVKDMTEWVRMREDLKRQEDRLFQAQKMEAIGRLAGGVAHDFNNLLSIISGNSQLLLLEEDMSEVGRETVENIRNAVDRASELILQLLMFSRKQQTQPKPLDLNHLISEEGRLLQRIIPKQIRLNFELAPGLPLIQADIMETRQIIMNLVLNARDAMPDGGEISLRTRRWDSTGTAPDHRPLKPGPFAWLTVMDTGIGMSEETQKHVFEPFFTTKEIGKGTGLGLATVYGIAEKRGGCVWLESQSGKGSAFHLCFPFSPPQEE